MFGIDHSSAPPNPSVLRVNGVRFVCRYLSTPGNPKNLTVQEVLGLRTHGITPVLVFETTADRSLAGHQAGVEDATSAAAQAAGVLCAGAPVYFAVDFDATVQDQAQINAYLDGAASVIGYHRVGIYGGYWPVMRALNAGKARYAWQTYAWSGGRWDPRIHLKQYKNSQTFCGIQADFDESLKLDFGQADPPVPVAVRRAALRRWVLARRAAGRSWAWLKRQRKWRLWRRLGGK